MAQMCLYVYWYKYALGISLTYSFHRQVLSKQWLASFIVFDTDANIAHAKFATHNMYSIMKFFDCTRNFAQTIHLGISLFWQSQTMHLI